jgi:hypothetical protein
LSENGATLVNLPRPVFVTAEEETLFGAEVATRLRRLRAMAWFLDRAFTIAGRHFGFDPLIGFIPAVGDAIGAGLSLYILYEAARIGIAWPVLARMALNILIDTVLGEIPVVGDAFDFVWQSNTWNLELIEKNLRPGARGRPIGKIVLGLIALALLVLACTVGLAVFVAIGLWKIFQN